MREDTGRVQIKHTIKRHLEKELQLRARGIKVLSLFFIDRVANYRDYDGTGQPVKGKFAAVFEAELAALAGDERYRDLAWLKESMEKLHDTSPRTRKVCSRTPAATPRLMTKCTT
jgi:type III restriction enzyme